eukprot:Rhum_TRINITY_DN15288_c0_g4::Rhum_TRINITY_DN15288_c0_g4_i1::g.147989::m.147989
MLHVPAKTKKKKKKKKNQTETGPTHSLISKESYKNTKEAAQGTGTISPYASLSLYPPPHPRIPSPSLPIPARHTAKKTWRIRLNAATQNNYNRPFLYISPSRPLAPPPPSPDPHSRIYSFFFFLPFYLCPSPSGQFSPSHLRPSFSTAFCFFFWCALAKHPRYPPPLPRRSCFKTRCKFSYPHPALPSVTSVKAIYATEMGTTILLVWLSDLQQKKKKTTASEVNGGMGGEVEGKKKERGRSGLVWLYKLNIYFILFYFSSFVLFFIFFKKYRGRKKKEEHQAFKTFLFLRRGVEKEKNIGSKQNNNKIRTSCSFFFCICVEFPSTFFFSTRERKESLLLLESHYIYVLLYLYCIFISTYKCFSTFPSFLLFFFFFLLTYFCAAVHTDTTQTPPPPPPPPPPP